MFLTQKFIASYLRYDNSRAKAQEIVIIYLCMYVIFSIVLAKESMLVLLALEIFLIIRVMDRRGEVAIMVDWVT